MEGHVHGGQGPNKAHPPHGLPQGTLAPTLPQVQQGCYWGPLAGSQADSRPLNVPAEPRQ